MADIKEIRNWSLAAKNQKTFLLITSTSVIRKRKAECLHKKQYHKKRIKSIRNYLNNVGLKVYKRSGVGTFVYPFLFNESTILWQPSFKSRYFVDRNGVVD